MAELTADHATDAACCPPDAQTGCCEHAEKVACCATAAVGGACGCAAATVRARKPEAR